MIAALPLGLALVSAPPPGPIIAPPEAPPPPPENAVTLEPLAVVFANTVAVEYERKLVDGISFAVGPSFTLGETTTGGEGAVAGDYLAWGLTLSLRFFPWSVAPEGPFLSPFGGVAWVSATAGDDAADGFGWSAGGLAGYTWILGRYFVFSVGAGAAWLDLDLEVGGQGGQDRGKRGVYPALRLAIGGAF